MGEGRTVSAVPAVLMRGGTSKGVFLHARDVPAQGAELDDLLLRIMGSPDTMQIDGLGGTYSSTSKVVIVDRLHDAIAYRFAQVSIDRASVDWSGNCGNLTTAVAPFAIDEGLVEATDGEMRVLLHNLNTGVHIEATVEVEGGRAKTVGRQAIAGVPGTGSPILTRYLNPAGSVLGSLLPGGAPTVTLLDGERTIDASIVDAAHPYVFVHAVDVGLEEELSDAPSRNTDIALLERIEAIRAAAAQHVGRLTQRDPIISPAVPRIVAVRPDDDGATLAAIAFSMGKVHRALPMTAALCLAAAVHIDGTVVAGVARSRPELVRIRHPRGVAPVLVDALGDELRSLGVIRTARRLMEGRAFPRPK
jgi:2-methylaconitate isomerase